MPPDMQRADACQYLIEPPDLWQQRVAARHREQAPRVVAMPDGGEGWAFEGGTWLRALGLEAAAGQVPPRDHGYTYASIRKGMHDAAERLKDMAADEVDVASIFPTYGLELRTIADPELHVACIRAYNDGVWEWARQGDPARLIPHALIPAVGFDAAMAELQRVAKAGFKGIVFSGWPAGGEYPEPPEDPFWALCAEAGLAVNLVRGGPAHGRIPTAPKRYIGSNGSRVRPQELALEAMLLQQATANPSNMFWFVSGGILERFPSLKLVLIDTGSGWLANVREGMNWIYRFSQFIVVQKLKHQPGDYVGRQVRATVRNERSAIEARQDIGKHTLMWASNYPNSTSSWPRSPLAVRDLLLGVPEDERHRILWENYVELYGIGRATA